MNDRFLPIGIQDFEKLRNFNNIYVDKTSYIYELARTSMPYFLSRPRRFGKSLLLSTLEAYFLGKKKLFKGLAIEKLEKDWVEYPVIKISFGRSSYESHSNLLATIDNILSEHERSFKLEKKSDNPSVRLDNLIHFAYEKTGKQVVILIDEYDKPILDALYTEYEEQNRQELRSFYSPLKDCDQYIRFLFITGITKVSHVNIFSGLNQLNDISLTERYSSICGISESELEKYFMPEIEGEKNAPISVLFASASFMPKSQNEPIAIPITQTATTAKKQAFGTAITVFLFIIIPHIMKDRLSVSEFTDLGLMSCHKNKRRDREGIAGLTRYHASLSRKSSRWTTLTPFSFPVAMRSSVTTYLG